MSDEERMEHDSKMINAIIFFFALVGLSLWVAFPQWMVMITAGIILVVSAILTLGYVAARLGQWASDLNERKYNK